MKTLYDGQGANHESYDAKLNRLVQWMLQAKAVVWFTGAGVSTESGLPDYVGPESDRDRARLHLPPVIGVRTTNSFQPNEAHRALVELEALGKCDFLISQNVDNLHLKSGFPFDKLAELHGNQRRLRCRTCDKTFPVERFRATPTQQSATGQASVASVFPDCGHALEGSVIRFGAPLPKSDLERSFAWARKASLMIVVGSSCQVVPAADIPRAAKRSGSRLVMINLGETELDELSDLHINEQTASKVLTDLLERIAAS